MNDQENRSIVLPHITKDADTVYLGDGDRKKTDVYRAAPYAFTHPEFIYGKDKVLDGI